MRTHRPFATARVAVMAFAIGNLGTPAPQPLRPDPTKTPGDAAPLTEQEVCQRNYVARQVLAETKRAVFAEYGITTSTPGDYEIDHLISLELGGSNSIRNLWPQSYLTSPWNAHVKDALENRLHKLVCVDKTISLQTAQRAIATDWMAAYRTYVRRYP